MPRPHQVVVLALPEPMAFELGVASKFLGSAVDDREQRLYRVRVATLDGGPVRTSGGYSGLPDSQASILDEADTVVVRALPLPTSISGYRLPGDVAEVLSRRASHTCIV